MWGARGAKGAKGVIGTRVKRVQCFSVEANMTCCISSIRKGPSV